MKKIIIIFKLVCVCTLLFSCVQPINTKAEEGEPIESPSVEVTPTPEITPTVETSPDNNDSEVQQVEETEDIIPAETEDVVSEETESTDTIPYDEYELTPPLFYEGPITEDYDAETLDNDPNDIMLMSAEDDAYLAPYKKAVEDALAKINLGSLGFFQSINATDAQSILNGTYNNAKLLYKSAEISYEEAIKHTNIGATGDATSLENFLEALNTIQRINEIRVQDGLAEIKITSSMMAMSEIQNNASAYTSKGYYHTGTFRIGENLAKVGGINGAIDGWYTEEKVNYETNNGGQTGHYTNIVSTSVLITGAAVTQNGMNGWVSYEQSFGGTYADNYSGDTKYSASEYYNMFMNYYNSVYGPYNEAVANLEQAKAETSWARKLVINTSFETTYYNYGVQKPKVLSVLSNGNKLVEGVDYQVVYDKNYSSDVGEFTYWIVGIGDNTGSITKKYSILPVDIANVDEYYLSSTNYTYDGKSHKPTFNIYMYLNGSKKYIISNDYTYEFDGDTVNPGIVKIKLTGKNNATGTYTLTYTISGISIENAVVSNIPNQVSENGVPVTPTPTVTLNGKALVKDIDYELEYVDNAAGGTGKVTVKGIGKYTGTAEKIFNIIAYPTAISANTSSVSLENGQTKQLSLTYTPSEYVDKSVTYSSNNNGVATVSSTGLIKAIKSGTTTITVTSVSKPTVKTSVTVTVTSPCTQLLFTNNKTSLTENYSTGDTKTIGYLAALSDGTAPTVSATSSDNSVATVTINNTNKTFTINAVKAGKATITITCGKKTITYIANVYSVSPSEKLVMETEGYETLGIEPGKTTQLNIYTSSDGTNTINDKIIYTSSDPSIATVDENGVITAIKSGTVKITATIKDDPLNRKVTQSIKVIAPQTDEITVGVTDENGNDISGTITQEPATAEEDLRLYIDWDDIYRGYKFVLTNELLDSTGNSLPGTKVKWTSNDTSVAKIATNSKTQVTTVTALKAGQVTLTCTSLDIYKKQIQVTLVIRDYQPRLQSNVYTINNNSTISQPLNIFASYGNQVQGATIYAKVGKVYSDTTKFTVNPDMTFKADPSLKNGNYPVQIVVTTTAGKRTYTYNATIKVVRTLPATTVKFTGNYNVFTDTDNALTTIYDHKQETPTNYDLDTNLSLYWDINPTTGEITKNSTPFPNNKPVVSGKVTITYDDYNLPVVKGIKIPVVSTKPSYVLSRTSTTLYNQNSNTITLQLLDSKTKEVIDLTGMTITLGTKSINGATITNDGTTITVTDTNMVSGNVIINVQDPSWITSINYTHKVVVSKTIAKASLSKTTLSLNSQVTGQTDSATVKLNQTNVELSATGTLTAKKPSVETAKLSVVYSDGEITAKVTDPSIKAGTYPYTLVMKDSNNNTLNTLTINVKVLTVSPTVSNKLTGTINPIDRENGYVTDTVTFKNINDTIATAMLSNNMFEAEVDETGKKVYIRAKAGVSIVNGQYYSMTLTIKGNECSTPIISTIKIRVVQSLPKLKVTNPTLTMYSSVNKADDVVGASLISITNKPGAQIESVTPMYNATLQKAFKYTFSQTSTGGIIQVTIKDPSKIKASSTSALKFKITYVDMATNTKTYSYVTIKVVDRTYKINALVKK